VESTGLTCTRANVAVITAYPETVEHSTLFRESGADKYWRKPADMLELPALLNEWFESEKP